MSRYRSTTSNDILCKFNQEWKTCQIPDCSIKNYTKSIEGNELRTQEFNFIESFRNTNRILLDKCFSDYCDYNTVKSMLTNNTVSKQLPDHFLKSK